MPSRLLTLVLALAIAAIVPAAASAATPFEFGVGAHPDMAVDTAGVAHVVWDESSGSSATPDPLHYCRLLPGASACSGEQVLHPPLDAIGRSSYVFAPSAGRVVIATYRCCGTGEGVWAYQSTDGGQSFDAGHQLGTLDFEQNAAFGPGDAITGGSRTAVQEMPLAGAPATTEADLDAGFSVPTDGSVAPFGASLVHVATDGDHASFNRLTGSDPNDAGSWTAATQLGPAEDPRLAAGPAGTLLLLGVGQPGSTRLVVRKYDGAGFGAPVTISETGDPIFPDLYAEPQTGTFYATWIDNRTPNQLKFASSKDGVTWSQQHVLITGDEPDNAFNLQIAAGPNGKGFVVYDRNGDNGKLAAVPFDANASSSSGGGSSGVNGGAGETPVQHVTVGGQVITLLAPKRCVKPGTRIRLRVTHRQKVRLSPKRRVKIVYVIFNLDKVKKKDAKAAFRKDFSTNGFKASSRHKVGAKIKLRPVKGHAKIPLKTLRGSFRICP